MTRDEAMELVTSQVSNTNLIKHMLATEAVMRELAVYFGEDEELWGLAGLLHDLDYDRTADDFQRHGLLTAEMLEPFAVDERIVHAIRAHPGHVPAESRLDKALYAVDPLTGLLVAAALMHPTRKIGNVDVAFVLKRFKEKRFAAGANREQIQACAGFGMELDQFVSMALKAMQAIDAELGL